MHAMTLLVTALLTILGLVTGALQYRDAKKKEFYATFWHRRMELYEQATDAAAAIAGAPNLEAVKLEHSRFWQLFWGPMSLVEDQGAKKAMEDFGGCLTAVEESSASMSSLRQPAYRLAKGLRESLARTWDTPFEFESLGDNANAK